VDTAPITAPLMVTFNPVYEVQNDPFFVHHAFAFAVAVDALCNAQSAVQD
jgi:hypothetical protein